MEKKIDQEIKKTLRKIEVAHIESERYFAKPLAGDGRIHVHNFTDMALAFDTEEYWLNEYEILLLKAFSNKTPWKIDDLLRKRLELQKNIEIWRDSSYEEKNTKKENS